ncbi:hypothetical protein W97_08415, partial [Coniosporium apollinis CBS 100218]
WKLEDVSVRPIKDDELLVQIIASGLCHTDVHFENLKDGPGVLYPRVLGHEGSGYVKQVGKNVTVAQPGDPVLLSFASCASCKLCTSDHPAHCVDFNALNFGGQHDFSASSSEKKEPDIFGHFFGQSSFASLTIVNERSVVNAKGVVKDDEELKMFAPLGCGIQTGSGTIYNVAAATPDDAVVVMGLGGVGLSGIMAAKLRGCKTIIGVDKVDGRMALAKELGATYTINTSGMELDELVKKVRELTDGLGATVTMDTTGFVPLITKAVEFTRFKGKVIQVGTAPVDAKLEIPIFEFMVMGKQYIGAVEGDAYPPKYVPEMIQWYRDGKFPVDKLVKFFKAEEYEKALHEMQSGEAVKPIIVW